MVTPNNEARATPVADLEPPASTTVTKIARRIGSGKVHRRLHLQFTRGMSARKPALHAWIVFVRAPERPKIVAACESLREGLRT